MDAGITDQYVERTKINVNLKQRKRQVDTKKNECKPWLKKMWCITAITQEYRERMYILLELYQQEYAEQYPVVCMDEKSKQLIEDIRGRIPMKPGSSAEKYDYEYKRNGTRNIFVAVEPLAGKRIIQVTTTRKKEDFAYFIKELVEAYPDAETIHFVLDNLNTHFDGSFYEAFSKREAKKNLDRITFHYTPKHGSWLNMAEIEINIMDKECLNRRIGTEEELKRQLKQWTKQRNKAKKKMNWPFKKKDADKKLSKHYVA